MSEVIQNRAPFVRITLVDSKVKIDPTDVISFQMKKINGESYNTFSILVQEKNKYSISKEIGEKKLEVQIAYGDTIENSKEYYGFILSYQSEFRGTNLYLTINGWVSTNKSSNSMPAINWSEYPEYHNNPSEIVQAIADKNDWIVDELVDTIPLRKLVDSACTYDSQSSDEWDGIRIQGAGWENTRTIEQRYQTDIQFINDTLIPISIARDTFLLEYVFTIKTSGGKTHISYKPANTYRNKKKNYCFVYNKPEGTFGLKEVISFNSGLKEIYSSAAVNNSAKSVEDAFSDNLGTASIDTEGMQTAYDAMLESRKQFYDIVSKSAYQNKVSQEDYASYVQQQLALEDEAIKVYEQASDVFMSIYYNKKIIEADSKLLKEFSNQPSDNIQKYKSQIEEFEGMSKYRYNATLQTLGNQQLSPGDAVDILVMLRQGQGSDTPDGVYAHYTSGTYLILGQVDKIELGKYTTDYTLLKNTQMFVGSSDELASLGLSLADVFHSSYDSESIPNQASSSETTAVNESTTQADGNLGTYRCTCYYLGDGSSDTTGSGKKIKDFTIGTVNGKKCYLYNGKIVCAAATFELKNSSYTGYKNHGGWRNTYLFRYWQDVVLEIDGKKYDGIILDSCGASTWAELAYSRIDIFVPPPSQGGGQELAPYCKVYTKTDGSKGRSEDGGRTEVDRRYK